MKLILCTKCGDIFSLTRFTRICSCGLSSGRYRDNVNAVVSGPCIVLGIANGSLVAAIREQRDSGDLLDGLGRRFEAFIIPDNCESVSRV
jgi:hypothetical protein